VKWVGYTVYEPTILASEGFKDTTHT